MELKRESRDGFHDKLRNIFKSLKSKEEEPPKSDPKRMSDTKLSSQSLEPRNIDEGNG